jgi:hypothetical protein
VVARLTISASRARQQACASSKMKSMVSQNGRRSLGAIRVSMPRAPEALGEAGEPGSAVNRGPFLEPPATDLAGQAAVHPVVFFGTGTGTPGIFTLTEPRWVRLVK